MKTTNAITFKIVQVTADKLGVDQNILTSDTSFADDLGADSLDIFELIMTIEKEFKLTINEDDVEKLTTVGALVDYVEGKTFSQQQLQLEPFTIGQVQKNVLIKN